MVPLILGNSYMPYIGGGAAAPRTRRGGWAPQGKMHFVGGYVGGLQGDYECSEACKRNADSILGGFPGGKDGLLHLPLGSQGDVMALRRNCRVGGFRSSAVLRGVLFEENRPLGYMSGKASWPTLDSAPPQPRPLKPGVVYSARPPR